MPKSNRLSTVLHTSSTERKFTSGYAVLAPESPKIHDCTLNLYTDWNKIGCWRYAVSRFVIDVCTVQHSIHCRNCYEVHNLKLIHTLLQFLAVGSTSSWVCLFHHHQNHRFSSPSSDSPRPSSSPSHILARADDIRKDSADPFPFSFPRTSKLSKRTVSSCSLRKFAMMRSETSGLSYRIF
jgi:hypothetical protein